MADLRMIRSLAAIVTATVGLSSLLTGQPAEAREVDLHITLTFVPTDTDEVLEQRGVVPAGGPPFEILPAVDTRPEPRADVGVNRETATPVRIWTSSNVAEWITTTLTDTFRGWGTVSVSGAPMALHTEVVKLFVIEEHTYQAEAVMKFSLKRRDGSEVWSGVVGGAASRFGRSLKHDNYKEVISDAVFSCYSKLWVDPAFRQAWSGRSGPGGGAGAAAKAAPVERMTPEEARKRLLELMDGGFEADVLAAWVRRVEFTRPFTSVEMVDWKDAGIPQAVIRAAME